MQAPERIDTPARVLGDPSGPKFLWDVASYERLLEMGMFENRRVELIEGEIIDLNAHTRPHIVGTNKSLETLRFAFPRADYVLTGQSTLYNVERSRPEPDIAVFRGNWNDLLADDPMKPVLVVEVSLETLAYDQGRKASFYASLGVRDYWVLNLRDSQLEVRREPRSMEAQTHGAGYASIQVFNREESVSPLELRHVAVAVADLLP